MIEKLNNLNIPQIKKVISDIKVSALGSFEYTALLIVFLLLFFAFIGLIRSINIKKTTKELQKKMLAKAMESENARQKRLQELLHENGTIDNIGLINRIERDFVHAGIKKPDSDMPTEYILLAMGSIYFVVSALVALITTNVVVGLLTFVALILGTMGYVSYKLNTLYVKLEKELNLFLDYARSFNATCEDIVTIYIQVARFVNEPLQSYLSDLHREATFKNKKTAFENLEKKINHAQLREIIHNTYVCSLTDSNYNAIFNDAKKNLEVYMDGKREREALKKANRKSILILIAVSAGCLKIFGNMAETQNVFSQLSQSAAGVVLLTLFGSGCLYGLYEVFKVDKE